MADLTKSLKIIDSHLKTNTFLTGNNITIADISLASTLFLAFRTLLEAKFRQSIENVTSNQAPFVKIFGKAFLCEKPFELLKPKGTAAAKAKPEKQQKQEKKKPDVKKEGEGKKEKRNEEADEDEPQKKEKNPLDLLPPTTFNLFDFKTLYVNAPNKMDALNFLWQNYDPQGFSIWKISYDKAEGEGVLMWRGVEIPAEIKEHPSYEYHKFDRLDEKNGEHKKIVEEYWTGLNEDESVVDGLIARTPKYFK